MSEDDALPRALALLGELCSTVLAFSFLNQADLRAATAVYSAVKGVGQLSGLLCCL